jgi:hypothetical protein
MGAVHVCGTSTPQPTPVFAARRASAARRQPQMPQMPQVVQSLTLTRTPATDTALPDTGTSVPDGIGISESRSDPSV